MVVAEDLTRKILAVIVFCEWKSLFHERLIVSEEKPTNEEGRHGVIGSVGGLHTKQKFAIAVGNIEGTRDIVAFKTEKYANFEGNYRCGTYTSQSS